MLNITTYGDWAKAGTVLRGLNVKLMPLAIAKIDEQGRVVLEKLKGHIDKQDLNWKPLAPSTTRIKGNAKIYEETGALKNGLGVRKIKSSKNDYSIFVGANPWKRHSPSGLKMSDVMIYLEYGTSKIPPRPLVQPTFEEVEKEFMKDWEMIIKELLV